MTYQEQVIAETQNWVNKVVIGCNFCPFAAKDVKNNRVRYRVEATSATTTCLETFLEECNFLKENDDIATTLLIFPNALGRFTHYLEALDVAEQLLEQYGFEGVFQVASFHPKYLFEGVAPTDPSNYTNRSPYPMFHLLREEMLEKALTSFEHPETIPERNIAVAQQKGLLYMQQLLKDCYL